MGRALLPGLGASLGFGIAFGYLLFPGPCALAAAGAVLVAAVWRRSVPLLWVATFALGLALPVERSTPSHLAFQLPNLREATGRVLDIPEPRAKNVSFTLALDNLPANLLAYVPPGIALDPGDRVWVRGTWGVPQPAGWREKLAREGIHGLFWATEIKILAPGPPGILRWASAARRSLLGCLADLSVDTASILAALLLGARGMLPDEDQEAFRTAGIAHVLALSGLHVGILAGGGWWLLGLLRVRPAWRYLVLVPAIGFYVLVGGARVSLIRAAIMFAILGLFWLLWERGWVLRKWLDPLQGLAVAAIVVLALWPWSALDTSFQLSFLATAGIIVFLPTWMGSELRGRLPGWVRRVADLAAVTMCAQMGAMPIIGTVFGYLSPYGLLANALLVPWTGAILWGGILLLALAALPVSMPLGSLAERVIIAPYTTAVRWLSSLPGASLPVGPQLGLWWLCAALGILLLRAVRDETGPRYKPPRHRASSG